MLTKALVYAMIGITLSGLTLFSLFASAEEELIPSWIKNTASFWVNGDVSDKEFISAIEWLLENNILQVSTTEDGEWKVESEKLYKKNQQLEKDIESLEARLAAFEQGIPPQTNPCDSNGDGSLTPQEIVDLLVSLGYDPDLNGIQNIITTTELVTNSPQTNGVLDTAVEIARFNGDYLVPISGISCTYP